MITIHQKQVMIENYKAIHYADESKMIIALDKQLIKICGVHLCIMALTKDEILITGDIQAVMFDE